MPVFFRTSLHLNVKPAGAQGGFVGFSQNTSLCCLEVAASHAGVLLLCVCVCVGDVDF